MNKTKSRSKSKSNLKIKSRSFNKTRKNKSLNRVFTKEDYNSGDGMLTSVWGPPMWHFLHTMSFNYPINPTAEDKKHYSDFIYNLRYVLPCKYCRINLTSNLKANPLLDCHMNSYCDVRERYEHFRSRCTKNDAPPKLFNFSKKKEKGCTEPLYGHKAKCVLSIVPQTTNVPSFQVDNKCVKYKVEKDEK